MDWDAALTLFDDLTLASVGGCAVAAVAAAAPAACHGSLKALVATLSEKIADWLAASAFPAQVAAPQALLLTDSTAQPRRLTAHAITTGAPLKLTVKALRQPRHVCTCRASRAAAVVPHRPG